MPDVLSNYFGNFLLTYLSTYGGFLAAHTSFPTVTGDVSTEVVGGQYARQPIGFNNPSGKAVVSNNNQTFPGMPAVTVLYLAVWDLVASGHMLFCKVLPDPGIVVLASGQLLVAPGDIALQL